MHINGMYLIVIAWCYVTVMMAIVEASSPQGSIVGALVTFVLYGLLPMAILVYILGTPQRKRQLKAQREAQQCAYDQSQAALDEVTAAVSPDASSHTPGGAEQLGITPVRKES